MQINIEKALDDYFPQRSFPQIYFEAVHNAVDAGATNIKIEIVSNGQVQDPVLTVTVSDDGRGFEDADFARFKELRSAKDVHHKGLGRLIFLAYFANVGVESTYGATSRAVRTFEFSRDGVSDCVCQDAPSSASTGSVFTFTRFRNSKLSTYADLRPENIKERLEDHFYPLLHSYKMANRPLRIEIVLTVEDDGKARPTLFPDRQVLEPSQLPELERTDVSDPILDMYSGLVIWHRVQEQGGPVGLRMIASVDGRTVPLYMVGNSAIPAGSSAFFLIESQLFVGGTDNSREKLVLSGNLTTDDLMNVLRPAIAGILVAKLPQVEERNERTREDLHRRYPHLLGLFDCDCVGLIDGDEAIRAAQLRFFAKQREVLGSDPNNDEAFEKALEVSSRALTEYVLYREHIIRRLEGTSADDLEDAVHEIIVPRWERFEGSSMVRDIYRNNVWLLDDKFMTFRSVLSEKEMVEVIAAISHVEEQGDRTRPDIAMVFSADPSSVEKVDVVVVEVKRRAVSDKDTTYAAVQLLKRARMLIDHCPNIQRMWYYALVDIDDTLAQWLQDEKWAPLYSKERVYHKTRSLTRKSDGVEVEAPTFFVSFDAVVKDAKSRNLAFLELLRSGFRALENRGNEPADAT